MVKVLRLETLENHIKHLIKENEEVARIGSVRTREKRRAQNQELSSLLGWARSMAR